MDTPIDQLHLFSGAADIYCDIQIKTAIYWHRLLHSHRHNPLYTMIDNRYNHMAIPHNEANSRY